MSELIYTRNGSADNSYLNNRNKWKHIRGLSLFLYRLRGLAFEALKQIDRQSGITDRKYQYAIMCAVTPDEISDPGNGFINRLWWQLLMQDSMPRGQRYVKLERTAVVVPYFYRDLNCYYHTEARLLDPTGQLLQEIGVQQPGDDAHNQLQALNNQSALRPRDFLKTMKGEFAGCFRTDRKPIIVILSHFLPCMKPSHRCADLIVQHCAKTQDRLVVAFDQYYGTQEQVYSSIKTLKQCANVNLVGRETFYQGVNIQLYNNISYARDRHFRSFVRYIPWFY